MALKLIVYDLDGTLVDTIGDVARSLSFSCIQHGLGPCTVQDILPFFGHGLKELVIGATGGKESLLTRDIEETFRGLYHGDNLIHQSKLYPGIKPMIQRFFNQKITQAVLTNKTEKPSRALLAGLDIHDYFSLIAGPDTYNAHKPDPEGLLNILEHHDVSADEAIMIGDSDTDIWAAKHSKVRSVAVLYGYKTRESLASSNPDFMVDTVSELEDLLHCLTQA